jgi:RNA polymerase sigma factor for flagellar operon FliA
MYTQTGVLDRESVVEQYGPMVRRSAAQLMARLPANVDINDLVQAGMIGLLDAVPRFDASQGTQFETFAMQRVRGAMLDELRGSDWMPGPCARTRERSRLRSGHWNIGCSGRRVKRKLPRT